VNHDQRTGPVSPAGGQVPGIRLNLLDGFELLVDGRPVNLPPAAQRLLAFLAVRGRPLSRAYVASTLWLDVPDERAAANLRSTLWRLQARAGAVIRTMPAHVRLAEEVGVDLYEARATAHRLIETAADVEMLLGSAALTAELLPDWYDDWVAWEREQFHQLRLHALEARAEELARRGRFGEAMESALAAVAAEPLRDSAHRAVIRVHLAEGNAAEAMLQFRRHERLLAAELGIAPSAEARELVGDIARREPALPLR
jgi:DNA-binding SARP family transcriptional activator